MGHHIRDIKVSNNLESYEILVPNIKKNLVLSIFSCACLRIWSPRLSAAIGTMQNWVNFLTLEF